MRIARQIILAFFETSIFLKFIEGASLNHLFLSAAGDNKLCYAVMLI